jgi:hypothetical protein
MSLAVNCGSRTPGLNTFSGRRMNAVLQPAACAPAMSHAWAATSIVSPMGDMTRKLADGPLYLIGSDPRFRAAVHAVFDPTGHGENLRVLIVGEDDLTSIPTTAPVYVMGRAHRELGDGDLARRVTPIRRVFSREMARELLTFIVRANIAAMSARAA